MHIALIAATIVLAAILVVLGLAAAKPNSFRLVRTAKIKAPPEAVFDHVVDFHRWVAWSPWEGMDTDLKRSYEGAPSGVGAVYRWEGAKTGVGRMEMVQARSPRMIGVKLEFIKPFAAHNDCEFTFEPLNDIDLGHVTAITWSMYGPSPFMSKLMTVFFSMDAMVGKDFERGLLKLKALCEA